MSSSRFTEHIDPASAQQSTSPQSDVSLDEILRLSQKSRSSSGESRSTMEDEQKKKKEKRGSRLLMRTKRKV
jgi:hypothetical protein